MSRSPKPFLSASSNRHAPPTSLPWRRSPSAFHSASVVPTAACLATKEKFGAGQMPGRLAGQTVDKQRQARLRPYASHARAAHPPREGDLEYLHQSSARRADGQHLHDRLRQSRPPKISNDNTWPRLPTPSTSSCKHAKVLFAQRSALQRVRTVETSEDRLRHQLAPARTQDRWRTSAEASSIPN